MAPPTVKSKFAIQASLHLLSRRSAASLRRVGAFGSLGAARLRCRTATLVIGAGLRALFATAEFGIRYAAARFIRTRCGLRGAAACLFFYHLGFAATCNFRDGFRRTTARLRLLAASQAFRATFLNGRTTSLFLGAAIHAFLTAAEPNVR